MQHAIHQAYESSRTSVPMRVACIKGRNAPLVASDVPMSRQSHADKVSRTRFHSSHHRCPQRQRYHYSTSTKT